MLRPSFEMSANTRLTKQCLASVKLGESITYADMSAYVGCAIKGGSPCVQSAQRSLLINDNIVFSPIRGVGLQRLTDEQIIAASVSDTDSIRRKARKSMKRITSIHDFSGLPPASQLQHTARLSIFSAIAELSRDSTVKKLEKAVSGRATELPIAETLKAFS